MSSSVQNILKSFRNLDGQFNIGLIKIVDS